MALTATAVPRVQVGTNLQVAFRKHAQLTAAALPQRDIIGSLGMHTSGPLAVFSHLRSFDRTNLNLNCKEKHDIANDFGPLINELQVIARTAPLAAID